MKAPKTCQVGYCCGHLAPRGQNRLQCDQAKHHSAWLVDSDGERKWEFSPRGVKYLKGKLVTDSSPGDKALVQLQQDTARNSEKKEAVQDPTLADLQGEMNPKEPVAVQDPTLADLQGEMNPKEPVAVQDPIPADLQGEMNPKEPTVEEPQKHGKKNKRKRSHLEEETPDKSTPSVPSVEEGEVQTTPPKKQARPAEEPSTTPPDTKPKETNPFGGKHIRSEGCVCCGCPRQRDQRGRLCPACLVHCKKLLGHQRIEDLLSNAEAVQKVRSMTESKHGREEEQQKTDQMEMLSRLEKIFKQIPRFEKLLAGMEKVAHQILSPNVD